MKKYSHLTLVTVLITVGIANITLNAIEQPGQTVSEAQLIVKARKFLELFEVKRISDAELKALVKSTAQTYPGFWELKANAQVALISLTSNRGTRINSSDRRIELQNIQNLVPAKDYASIAKEIRSMNRLWEGSLGLQQRREEEARLVEPF